MQPRPRAQPHDELPSPASHPRERVRIPEEGRKGCARTDDAEPAAHFRIHDRRAAQSQILSDGFIVLGGAKHAQPHEWLLDAFPMTIANLRRTDAHHIAVRLLEPPHGTLQGDLTLRGYQQAARTRLECSAVFTRQHFYRLARKGELEPLGPMRAAAFYWIVSSHDTCITPARCGCASHHAAILPERRGRSR